MIPIKTDRLLIRLAIPEDAEAIYGYRSDFEENKYQGWFPSSAQEVYDYLKNMPGTLDVADVCYQFAILVPDQNKLIGDMGIIFTNHDNLQAEVGCTLSKEFQGKGYATEALKGMIQYLFDSLGKHRVVASLDPRNGSSERLIKRLGFRKEAYFKESYYMRGEWVDDMTYAMLRDEWTDNG